MINLKKGNAIDLELNWIKYLHRGKLIEVRVAIILILITLLALSITAYAINPDNKILQFNYQLVSNVKEQSEQKLPQAGILARTEVEKEQTSEKIILKHEISQNLEMIIQKTVDIKDEPFKVDIANQDTWRQQMESSFDQILGVNAESQTEEETMSEFYIDENLRPEVTSNIFSLVDYTVPMAEFDSMDSSAKIFWASVARAVSSQSS